MTEQLSNDWPGLTKHAQLICEVHNNEWLFNSNVSKGQFKEAVKKACKLQNELNLKSQISGYKKMSALRDELTKGNAYFYRETLQNVRNLFRFRVDLIESKMNFKKKYQNEQMLCDSCESSIDVNSHILHCPAYTLLRQNRQTNNDTHLAEYIKEVMEIRINLRLNR